MRFILCARDRTTGTASLPSTRTYESRAEAVEAVASFDAPGTLVGSDLFVVDLDAAIPVVIVVGAAVPPSTATVPAEPDETPAGSTPPPAPVAVAGWPFVPADDDGVGPSTLASDAAIEDADRASVWWLDAATVTETPVEPFRQQVVQEETAPEWASATSEDRVEPEGDVTEKDGLTAHEVEAGLAEESEPVLAEADAYTPIRVDFDVWSCSDCIFTTTCPKIQTHRPATCGSFQWKSA
jgi:hypothetical protein